MSRRTKMCASVAKTRDGSIGVQEHVRRRRSFLHSCARDTSGYREQSLLLPQASLVRKRMLAGRSGETLQDSQSAAWYWGAVAAAICNAVLIAFLAAARAVIFHGASLRELGGWAVGRSWASADAIMVPVKQGRYPLGSCGAVATALLVGASMGSFTLRTPFHRMQPPAATMTDLAEQSSTWRARRQCTLILLCIIGMAQLSSLACTNWAAAYAAASVCVPAAIGACRTLG